MGALAQSALAPESLRRVRWFGVIGFAGLVFIGLVSSLPTPPVWIGLSLLVVAICLNLVLWALRAQPSTTALGLVLCADVGVITVFLATSGGAANPFTLLYLFPVVLASLALPPVWTGGLMLGTTAAFAGLFLTGPEHMHHMDMRQHLLGMVVAYAATIPFLAGSVYRFRRATDEARAETAAARSLQERAQRLSALAGLAGGAAHELSTPLSTILLVTGELQRVVTDVEQLDDLQLIREQVERCREVLDHLAVEVGAGAGESAEPQSLQELVEQAVGARKVEIMVKDATVTLPQKLISHALHRLLGNARDAGGPVALRAFVSEQRVHFEVEDHGEGMSVEVLERAREPFFSTKPSGSGRGLGLFFVSTVAQQLGGSFELSSTLGEGTTASLILPCGERRCTS